MTLEAHEVRAGAELHCSPDPVDVMVNKYLNDTYCVLKNPRCVTLRATEYNGWCWRRAIRWDKQATTG